MSGPSPLTFWCRLIQASWPITKLLARLDRRWYQVPPAADPLRTSIIGAEPFALSPSPSPLSLSLFHRNVCLLAPWFDHVCTHTHQRTSEPMLISRLLAFWTISSRSGRLVVFSPAPNSRSRLRGSRFDHHAHIKRCAYQKGGEWGWGWGCSLAHVLAHHDLIFLLEQNRGERFDCTWRTIVISKDVRC